LQDGRRDFFDGFGGGRQPAYARAAHHGFGLLHLQAAVFQAGVARVGAAFAADFGQTLGADGEAKNLLAVRHQGRGELAPVKVFRDQGVIGRLEAMLHGQVQAGGRFAAARYAHQNHIRTSQVVVRLAVVVRQAEVDGLDAVVVFLALADVRKPSHAVVRLDAQLHLQRVHKGAEHVQQHALAALLQHFEHFHVHQGGKDHALAPLQFGRVVDLAHRLVGLVRRVDERQAHAPGHHFELRQDGVAKGFGGNACAVRHEKNGTRVHVNLLKKWQTGAGRIPGARPYNGGHYSQIFAMRTVGPQVQIQSPAPRLDARPVPCTGPGADPVLTLGAFPCLHALRRPPWSYRLKT